MIQRADYTINSYPNVGHMVHQYSFVIIFPPSSSISYMCHSNFRNESFRQLLLLNSRKAKAIEVEQTCRRVVMISPWRRLTLFGSSETDSQAKMATSEREASAEAWTADVGGHCGHPKRWLVS